MQQRWRIGWTELAIGCSCPSSERPVCAEADISRAIANGGCHLYDSLTNLPNQVLFQKRLQEATVAARQGRAMVAVLCVDLDRFEGINRRFGPAAADRLIEACAQRLRASLQEQDVVARLDGNEFAVLQLAAQRPQVETLCQRLLATLAAPYDLDGREVVVTASIGVAPMPSGEPDPEQSLRNARIALCQAKSEGRATYRWFEPEPEAGATAARLTDDDLCAGLLDDQFELHYQPRVAAASRRWVGVEALVRWRHPTRGLLPPEAFVPLAETDRPILALDEWALRTACRQALAWPDLRVAISLSRPQFQGHDPVGFLRQTLAESGFEPECLELEITEDVLLHDRQRALVTLWQLKSLGVQIVIDDFGSRYTSLGSLLNGPLDKLKIDRPLLYGVDGTPQAEVMLRALIGLGQSLGVQTCVAGIETAEQVAWLCQQGCHELQGSYFADPVPAAELTRLLAGPEPRPAGASDPVTASA
jgi:diguanylate cyclase (GGDEF)-like protein